MFPLHIEQQAKRILGSKAETFLGRLLGKPVVLVLRAFQGPKSSQIYHLSKLDAQCCRFGLMRSCYGSFDEACTVAYAFLHKAIVACLQ